MRTGRAPFRVMLCPAGAATPRTLDVTRGVETRTGAKRRAREFATDVVDGIIHVEELQDAEGGGKKYVRFATGTVAGGKLKGWT